MSYARVTLTLDITVGSSWGNDCRLSQVYEQAKVDALGIIDRLRSDHRSQIAIVGEPKVVAVIAETKP